MERQHIVYGVIGLFLGIVIAWAVAVSAVNSQNADMMRAMGMKTGGDESASSMDKMGHGSMGHAEDMSDMSMNEMSEELEGLTGDEFDKRFLDSMIVHHQGAIEMANAAKAQAGHQEIKDMADDIISAQNGEIKQMRAWQQEWGY